MKTDVVIIGKGPAGISCAIYLKRYGYEPLVIAKDGGALERVSEIENYYGFSTITGPELLKQGELQAKHLGITVLDEEVLSIEKWDDFTIETNKNKIQSKIVVLACGSSRNRFAMADQYEGVSYCAICDGFFYRKKKIALIGSGSYMAHEFSVLKPLAKEIVIFTNGKPLTAELSEPVKIITEPITKVIGNTKIEAIVAGNQEEQVDGCFIAIGNASGFTLAKHLGIALKGNMIQVDENFKTNIDGLYACGDVIGGLLQISKAVGEGALCATAIANEFKKNKSNQ